MGFFFPQESEQCGDFYPLTSFTAKCKWVWLSPGPCECWCWARANTGDASPSQAAQHCSSYSACSIPSQSPAGCILTSFWPFWPWNWSALCHVCSSTQVRTAARLLLSRPSWSLVHYLCNRKFSQVAGNLLSTHLSHCWPQLDFSPFKSRARSQWVRFLNLCHPQIFVN